METGFVLALALALDLVFGEPPSRWHPVAWVGRLLGWGARRVPGSGPHALLAWGAVLLLLALGVTLVPVALLTARAEPLGWLGLLLQAWLLKCAFSLRGLHRAAREVRAVLAAGRLEQARSLVGWHLVSRPTERLSSHQVASATVESLAENLTDSVVAPLCFFLVGGLPAAWAYRVVNTADAMLGYRDARLEYVGKAAARLDDLLNLIPARLAALGIVAGALFAGGAPVRAWRVMWRDHALTASPNAGWTMSAMAGALGVILEKPGLYRLGDGALPVVESVNRAMGVMVWAAGLFLATSLSTAFFWR